MIKKTCKFVAPIILINLILFFSNGFSQGVPDYKNPAIPIETRVKDLLGRMTPEEKFYQLFMVPGDLSAGKEKFRSGIFGLQISAKGMNNDGAGQLLKSDLSGSAVQLAAKINQIQTYFREGTRLGIPIIPFEEALHGLLAPGATVFPQSIGLASTFDRALMRKVAGAIARETRSRGIRQVLSPVINIARDVRWGRTEETYGEDPYLTSEMGRLYISEMESAGIIATPKHFAVNSGDGGRDSYPINISEYLMEEIYFPAFKTAIQQANARSVMTAYNSFDGSPCSASNWLLNTKLKREWGFGGFVISDACAVGGANVLHFTAGGYSEAGKQAVENGLDVIFQTDIDHASLFSGPFLDGSVRRGAIDSAVTRVLRAKFELGLFENPYIDTVNLTSQKQLMEHRETTLQAARESIVLLKNENGILPISPKVKSIAVIGTEAMETRFGGYSGTGNDPVSILDGIRNTAPAGIKIYYSPGCGRTFGQFQTVPADNLCSYSNGKKAAGLHAEYFDNTTFEGLPKVARNDATIDFMWTLYPPDPSLLYDWYSVRWTGSIVCRSTGKFRIGMEGNDGYRLYINGLLLIDNWIKKSYDTRVTDFTFEKGKEYDLRIEYYENTGNARLKLVWNAGISDTTAISIEKAVEIAAKSDVAIVVAGFEEGEFKDRSSLKLPGGQEDLIRAVASTGKPVIVLLSGGSAVTMSNWINQVQGLADIWYPGEAGGLAVADVIFGRYNPAGRLPVTFPVSEGQLPLVYNHKPTGRGDDYVDLSGMPLFPFGYGLSYTTFEYGNMKIDRDTIHPGDSAIIRFTLKNTGKISGDEVYQVYIRDELASLSRPVAELKAFDRIRLEPGEEKEIRVSVMPDQLSMLYLDMKRVTEQGSFRVMIGSSSKDIRLRKLLYVTN